MAYYAICQISLHTTYYNPPSDATALPLVTIERVVSIEHYNSFNALTLIFGRRKNLHLLIFLLRQTLRELIILHRIKLQLRLNRQLRLILEGSGGAHEITRAEGLLAIQQQPIGINIREGTQNFHHQIEARLVSPRENMRDSRSLHIEHSSKRSRREPLIFQQKLYFFLHNR